MFNVTNPFFTFYKNLHQNKKINLPIIQPDTVFSTGSALSAVEKARRMGIKVGLLRLLTVWPFPRKIVRELSQTVRKIIDVEINWGQMLTWIQANVEDNSSVEFLPEISKLHEPKQILNKIKEVA